MAGNVHSDGRGGIAVRRPEQALHKPVADLLSAILIPPTWFSTFPSGGGGKVRGSILKGLGLKAGVPDLLIVHEGRAYWIELKAPKTGRLSEAQKVTQPALRAAGSPVANLRTIDEVLRWLALWNIPTRIHKVAA